MAQMVLAIADGATCLSDLAAIRAQPAMFGAVASDATVWRTFDQIDPVDSAGSPPHARQREPERGRRVPARPATH